MIQPNYQERARPYVSQSPIPGTPGAHPPLTRSNRSQDLLLDRNGSFLDFSDAAPPAPLPSRANVAPNSQKNRSLIQKITNVFSSKKPKEPTPLKCRSFLVASK